MNERLNAPLSEHEQQRLRRISQLDDLDAQADALRIQLATVIAAAQRDDSFNMTLIEYVYALQAAGDDRLALLVDGPKWYISNTLDAFEELFHILLVSTES